MKVECCNYDCVNYKNEKCSLKSIFINEEGMCSSYEIYTETDPSYQNEYWIACKDENGNQFRIKKHGYKYIWKDITLYTSDDIRQGLEKVRFTEESTGFCVGMGIGKEQEDNYEKIKEIIKNSPSVMSYPIGKIF